MSAPAPRLLGDYMSQPFRSCIVFCRAAGVPVEVVSVLIAKGDNRKPEFLKLSPLGKIPCLQDGDFAVVESAAIMRYLCETRAVADHWWPGDPRRRTRVDAAMCWHLNNLRIGSMLTAFNRAVYKNLRGVAPRERLVTEYALPLLKASLKALDAVWLGSSSFVAGQEEVSLADLLMACEVEMLCLLDAADQGPSFDELLAPYPRIKPWLARVSNACAPHYEEAHAVLRKVRARMLATKEAEERGGGGSSRL